MRKSATPVTKKFSVSGDIAPRPIRHDCNWGECCQ